ncbi:uncharacterized protein METZ01_LOCUS312008 [marine metagenome]|uniref:Uncharacterized protein n=1 Tax=marine metagenome TaxID=408172 RepID=A0A382ND68_9ZZZZ|tara:strand:+ start:1590 stop:1826 length:237 start_codon:yes stop_codon:yes gene_type:complete
MEVANIFGLIGLAIVNTSAIIIAFLRQQKSSRSNYGIKNGRGDLFTQIGNLQDDIIDLREDVAEMKGTLKAHIMAGSR